MLFAEIVECSESIALVNSRTAKASLLAGLMSRLARDELTICVHYMIGKLRQGKIGLGPSAVHAAMPSEAVSEPSLTVLDIDTMFHEVSQLAGPGSQRAKVNALRQVLERATEREQRFMAMLVYGELHQGAMEGVMIDAIVKAASVPLQTVQRAVMATGDLAAVAVTALTEGSDGLSRFGVTLFRPVLPMLAQPGSSAAEVFTKHSALFAEYKLDGARIQVHKGGDDIRIYSRALRDVTHAIPEVVDLVRRFPARNLVLDGEVLAFRRDGRPHSFQTTMRRFGRKLDVDRMRSTLPLTPAFFDILYDGEAPTIDMPFHERAELLRGSVGDCVVQRKLITTTQDADAFLAGALAAGHEGIMLKVADSAYTAGARGADWMKIKPAHTLDLTILAADWGHGRRTGWLSNLHLGARDPATQGFVMLGKTFKGMTDEMLNWVTQRLLTLETHRDRYTVYVKPELVAEVAFNDVQESRRYPGGVALRFARIKRFRDDKNAAGADTLDTVRALLPRSAE